MSSSRRSRTTGRAPPTASQHWWATHPHQRHQRPVSIPVPPITASTSHTSTSTGMRILVLFPSGCLARGCNVQHCHHTWGPLQPHTPPQTLLTPSHTAGRAASSTLPRRRSSSGTSASMTPTGTPATTRTGRRTASRSSQTSSSHSSSPSGCRLPHRSPQTACTPASLPQSSLGAPHPPCLSPLPLAPPHSPVWHHMPAWLLPVRIHPFLA